MMSEAAQALLDQELVMVIDSNDPEQATLYPHEQFIAATQQATLDRLEAMVPKGGTLREAHRALASMRTPVAHKLVLAAALAQLERHGTPVNPEQVTPKQRIVACFPGT